MLFLFPLLLAWMTGLTGLGMALRFLVRPDLRGLAFAPADPLVGMLFAGFVATIANFFVPIGSGFSWLCLGTGLACFAARHARSGSRAGLRDTLPHLAFAAVAAAVLTHRAGYHEDIGAHQLPAVLWSLEGPVPRGLANLNPRLGFNSEWFVIDALTRVKGAGVGPSLATALAAWAVAWACWWAARRAKARIVARAFGALLPLALLSPALFSGFNAPATDAPVLIAWLGAGAVIVAHEAGVITVRDAAALTWLTAMLGVLARLSALPLLVVPALLTWRARDAKLAFGLAAASALLAAPWLARGVWTSGCFVFPVAATCVDVRWLVDAAKMTAEGENVRNWAMMPYWKPEALAAGTWVGDWARRQVVSPDLLGPLAVAAAGLLARPAAPSSRPALRALGIAALAQLAFVGATAPDIRFAAGAPWAAALAFTATRFANAAERQGPARFIRHAPLVFLAPLMVTSAAHFSRGLRHIGDAPRANVRPPAIANEVVHREEVLSSGLRVNVPVIGIACWATALPCTAAGWVDRGLTAERDAAGRISMFIRGGK